MYHIGGYKKSMHLKRVSYNVRDELQYSSTYRWAFLCEQNSATPDKPLLLSPIRRRLTSFFLLYFYLTYKIGGYFTFYYIDFFREVF